MIEARPRAGQTSCYWDRGRPARRASSGAPTVRENTCETSFALRAHCGRDARGPSSPLSVISSGILFTKMKIDGLIEEILAVYRKHGWQLRRVLLRPESRAELENDITSLGGVAPQEAEIDALWFSRPSHEKREAWELRLLAENPYALFETFEADETEEEREDVRREMEARMREYFKSEK